MRGSGKGVARCVYGDNKRGVFVGFIRSGFEGVPDNAMEWVEEWDKFDDEGTCACDLFPWLKVGCPRCGLIGWVVVGVTGGDMHGLDVWCVEVLKKHWV